MIQTWWLSFVKDNQSLGVCIVEPESEELEEDDKKGWLAEAVRMAWMMCCNPGGSVGAHRLDHLETWQKNKDRFPKNRLLSVEDIRRIDNET